MVGPCVGVHLRWKSSATSVCLPSELDAVSSPQEKILKKIVFVFARSTILLNLLAAASRSQRLKTATAPQPIVWSPLRVASELRSDCCCQHNSTQHHIPHTKPHHKHNETTKLKTQRTTHTTNKESTTNTTITANASNERIERTNTTNTTNTTKEQSTNER